MPKKKRPAKKSVPRKPDAVTKEIRQLRASVRGLADMVMEYNEILRKIEFEMAGASRRDWEWMLKGEDPAIITPEKGALDAS